MLEFSDAGIQDISTSISINERIQKNLNDLTERCESDDDDEDESDENESADDESDEGESDEHLEARDHRSTCLILRYSM